MAIHKLIIFYSITVLFYHIGLFQDILAASNNFISIFKKILTNIIKITVSITWIISFFFIKPFNTVFSAKLQKNEFLYVIPIFTALYGIYIRSINGSSHKIVTLTPLYKFYLIVETVAFVIILTLLTAFFKNIYETLGPVQEDFFMLLLEQRKTYKINNVIFVTFFKKYALTCFLPSFAFTIHYYFLCNKTFIIKKTSIRFRLHFRLLPLLYLASVIYFFSIIVKPIEVGQSDFLFEKNMVTPHNSLLQFPTKKKNIIMIGLESLDTTYYSTKNGGCINNIIIKNMEEMALDKNNVHFSHLKYPKLGGMSTLWRTGFTLGSTFAALCGAPFMGKNEPTGTTEGYLNNLTCLGELLNEANYITSTTYGSLPFDWGYGHVFDYHHYQRINVVGEILKNQTNSFWFDDYLTYGVFKTELNFLSKQGKPFFAFMPTLDTHEPGFSCYLCPKEDNKMLQAAKCADNQLKNFLSWAKNQQWYNNTVFMIFGDHVTREIGIQEIAKAQNYKRASYDLIINSELKSNNTYERLFTSFDLMPTVLAAAGVKIKGDRLGQGVNLFSDIPTHYETYGTKFDNSFDDVNKWYETVIMHKPTACDDSNPCIFMQSLILDTKYSNLNISN